MPQDFVANYSAVSDMQFFTAAVLSITINTNALHSATPLWTAGDVGKAIRVGGIQDAFGNVLVTTITGYSGPQDIALGNNAGATIVNSSQFLAWGTDNTPMGNAFNTANAGLTGVVLTIQGSFMFGGNGWVIGNRVKQLTVQGVGTAVICGQIAFSSVIGMPLWGDGSSFVNAVSAGDMSVTCKVHGEAARWATGSSFALTALDTQNNGDCNPAYWEYGAVLSNDPSTGVVAFTAPVTGSYKDTFPCYDPGLGSSVNFGIRNQGGPATLYLLDPAWDCVIDVNDLEIVTDPGRGLNSVAKKVTFNRCSGPYTSVTIAQTTSFTHNGCSFPNDGVEIDKMIDKLTVTNSIFHSMFTQSSSPKQFIDGGGNNFVNGLQGGGKNVSLHGSTYGAVTIGVAGFGVSDTLRADSCSIGAVNYGGPTDNIGEIDGYTISNGVISLPLGAGPRRWAIPDHWCFFYSNIHDNEGFNFKINDITTNGRSVYAGLTLALGTNTLSSDVPLWLPGDAGEPIYVHGAGGPPGNPLALVTRITVVTDSTHIVLADNASNSITSATKNLVSWGRQFIHTTIPGSVWPPAPVGTGLRIHALPAKAVSITNCVGCPDIVDLSQAPAGATLYVYTKRSYDQTFTVGAALPFEVWGQIVRIKINVITPYLGSINPATVNPLAQGDAGLQFPDGSGLLYRPIINLKLPGIRIITPTGISGLQSGDTLPPLPARASIGDMIATYMNQTLDGACRFSIEIATDPGIPGRPLAFFGSTILVR